MKNNESRKIEYWGIACYRKEKTEEEQKTE
jgi:hypothetical protein